MSGVCSMGIDDFGNDLRCHPAAWTADDWLYSWSTYGAEGVTTFYLSVETL